MPCLVRRRCSSVAASSDRADCDLSEWLCTGTCEDVADNVFPLPSRCHGKRRPCGCFAIARNEPGQRFGCGRVFFGRRQASLTGDCSLIFGIELWRPEPGPDARAWAVTFADVPDGFPMLGGLAMEMRGARSGHSLNHRTIPSSDSRAFSRPVDLSKRTIMDWPPSFISTSDAPACFAARITRAISACVIWAGRRLIGSCRDRLLKASRRAHSTLARHVRQCRRSAEMPGGTADHGQLPAQGPRPSLTRREKLQPPQPTAEAARRG